MQKLIIFLPILLLAACNTPSNSALPSAEKAVEGITCNDSQSRLFDVLYSSLIEMEEVPTESEMTALFEKALDSYPDIRIEKAKFIQLVTEFYQILLKVPAKDSKELLEKVAALEIGDQTTLEAQSSQNELQSFSKKWNAYVANQDIDCTEGTQPVAGSPAQSPGMVYGARKVLVTAYQSCSANTKPAMTSATSDVQGISIVGTHTDGVGSKRKITSLSSLLKTAYYLQSWSQGLNCKDTRSNPLIYDYGGKPYVTTADNSTLNLFKNAGSGTTVLGIDCSGYVFSAAATAGLKFHPDKRLKPMLVHGTSATMFMDPANNGMPCFEKVKMGVSGTLKAGDVVAIRGHVFVIDSVGTDPLGILAVKTVDQCSALTYKNFKFVVAQSSNSKNGIGINKFNGKDYLAEETTIRVGFEKYARDACKARLLNKNQTMLASNFQIVRHKMTAACMDRPVALDGEVCANSCSILASSAELNSSQAHTE